MGKANLLLSGSRNQIYDGQLRSGVLESLGDRMRDVDQVFLGNWQKRAANLVNLDWLGDLWHNSIRERNRIRWDVGLKLWFMVQSRRTTALLRILRRTHYFDLRRPFLARCNVVGAISRKKNQAISCSIMHGWLNGSRATRVENVDVSTSHISLTFLGFFTAALRELKEEIYLVSLLEENSAYFTLPKVIST